MEFIHSVDFAILDFIQQFIKCPFLDIPMMVIGYLGEAGGIWIIAGIVMLFFKKTRATGVMVLTALLLVFLVGEVAIKHLVARPRPFLFNTDITLNIYAPPGHSFPSSHTALGFAASIIIFIRERKAFGIPALILAFLIGFSRLYNYVHFPSDVLGGMLLGTMLALLTLFVFRKTKLDRRLAGQRR